MSLLLRSRFLGLLAAFACLLACAPARAAAATPELTAAVAKLVEVGVIEDGAYWLAHTERGKSCDGEKVAALIIAASKRQGGTASDLAGALAHLATRQVITKTEYWQEHAVADKRCSGRQVALLLSRLARTTR